MKKKFAVKLATTLCALTAIAVPYINFPNSFALWGEPTPPLEKDNK